MLLSIIQVQKNASEHRGIYRTELDSDSLGNYIWFKQIKILGILWKKEEKVGLLMEDETSFPDKQGKGIEKCLNVAPLGTNQPLISFQFQPTC